MKEVELKHTKKMTDRFHKEFVSIWLRLDGSPEWSVLGARLGQVFSSFHYVRTPRRPLLIDRFLEGIARKCTSTSHPVRTWHIWEVVCGEIFHGCTDNSKWPPSAFLNKEDFVIMNKVDWMLGAWVALNDPIVWADREKVFNLAPMQLITELPMVLWPVVNLTCSTLSLYPGWHSTSARFYSINAKGVCESWRVQRNATPTSVQLFFSTVCRYNGLSKLKNQSYLNPTSTFAFSLGWQGQP